MNVIDALKTRRSVRAYQDKPVDDALIKQIFSDAQLSASNCNTQPWHVSVVSGEPRKKLEERMMADVMSGKKPQNHFPAGDGGLVDEFRKRQIACAVSLYDSMDIKYEEKEKRQALMLKNWQFFGAPHVAFFSMPKEMGQVNSVDIGIHLQSVMLLMADNGIACCPQGALAMFPDAAYEIAKVPENNGILCGLSFGYADADNPINKFDVGRAQLDDSVTFIS